MLIRSVIASAIFFNPWHLLEASSSDKTYLGNI